LPTVANPVIVAHAKEVSVMGKLNGIVIDCADPRRAANFWAQALEGYEIDEQPWGITMKSESDPMIFFEVVPEGKASRTGSI
jgi:Glyoxalase-like domain